MVGCVGPAGEGKWLREWGNELVVERVIACYTLRRGLHSGFEVLVGRIDEKPFSQHLMRHQRREFGLNGGVMLVAGT